MSSDEEAFFFFFDFLGAALFDKGYNAQALWFRKRINRKIENLIFFFFPKRKAFNVNRPALPCGFIEGQFEFETQALPCHLQDVEARFSFGELQIFFNRAM